MGGDSKARESKKQEKSESTVCWKSVTYSSREHVLRGNRFNLLGVLIAANPVPKEYLVGGEVNYHQGI